MIIRVNKDRLAWPIGLIDAGRLPFLSEAETTGGNHDPRKATGTHRIPILDNYSGFQANAATLEKLRGTVNGPKPKYC